MVMNTIAFSWPFVYLLLLIAIGGNIGYKKSFSFFRVAATSTVAAAATGCAATTAVGAADAFLATLFRLDYITGCCADNDHKTRNNNRIFHNYFFPLSAYSVLTFLSAWMHRYTTMAAITATAIKPPTKPAPKEPVVIRVPIW